MYKDFVGITLDALLNKLKAIEKNMRFSHLLILDLQLCSQMYASSLDPSDLASLYTTVQI